MRFIDNDNIDNIIWDWIEKTAITYEDEPDAIRRPTDERVDFVKNVYFNLQNEEKVKQYSPGMKQSLLDNILEDVFILENKYDEEYGNYLRRYGDNSHMEYYNIVLRPGETNEIESVLAKYNIPSSVLRGIKMNQEHDGDVRLADGRNVRIIQEVEKQEGVSPEVVEFAIIVDGVDIYRWSERLKEPINMDEQPDSVIKRFLKKEVVEPGKTAVKKKYNGYRADYYKDKKGEIKIRYIGKNPKTGRTQFLSKELIEEYF